MTCQNSRLTILSPGYAVGPLLTPKTLRLLKTLGFASVINTLSEDSVLSDIHHSNLAEWVRGRGMEYRDLGVSSINIISDETAARFRTVLAEVPRPVFIFSRSGSRATALWAAAMAGTLTATEIREATARAGHDVSFLIGGPDVQNKQVA